MEKIVVTGGLGFIGSHIAEHFVSSGFHVTALDSSQSEENVSSFKKNNLEIVHASITDYASVKAACRDAKYVFHQAALVSVPLSVEKPKLAYEINVQGTLNVLKAASDNGVKRAILASSSAVYGNNPPPLKESMKPDPLSPYAESKLENERQARDFYQKHGLETVCLRYFNVYGPRQDPKSAYAAAVPRFLTVLKAGKRPTIYGDGTQTRDFIYVKDVARANALASSAGKDALGKAFNIASGKQITIIELLEKLGALTGTKPSPIFEPERKGDIKHSYADVSLAKKHLSFSSEWALERGLEETISSFSGI